MGLRYPRVLISAGVFGASYAFFHYEVSTPRLPYFDEALYVPAARSMLINGPLLNAEHPPLAKQIIALGLWLGGDDAEGWRLMSAVFGAIALVGVYLWSLQLLSRQSAAIWSTVIALVNQGIYVESRIAMLDIFLLTFLIWALTFFSLTWTSQKPRWLFAATGICVGLSAACKWTGIAEWIMMVVIVATVKALHQSGVKFLQPRDTDWYRTDLWKQMRKRDWILALLILPVSSYVITFVPHYGLNATAILERQLEMWHLMTRTIPAHPYASPWQSWPFMIRPIWYFWESAGAQDVANSVVYLSNPLINWAGLAGVCACLYGWIKLRRANAFLILISWVSLYAFWALVPRSVKFAYYYLPSLTILSPALGYVFYETKLAEFCWARRGFAAASIVIFLYFIPFLSAAVGVSIAGYQQRMWLSTWH